MISKRFNYKHKSILPHIVFRYVTTALKLNFLLDFGSIDKNVLDQTNIVFAADVNKTNTFLLFATSEKIRFFNWAVSFKFNF